MPQAGLGLAPAATQRGGVQPLLDQRNECEVAGPGESEQGRHPHLDVGVAEDDDRLRRRGIAQAADPARRLAVVSAAARRQAVVIGE